MTIQLVCLPHVRLGTATTHLCAYSGKVMKFCKMMGAKHKIVLYAPESDPVPRVAEQVNCLSEDERIATFGADDANRLPAWPTDVQSAAFNRNVVREIRQRAMLSDLVFLTGGWTHKPVADALPGNLLVEGFVGYEGILQGNVHAAYESYFHMAQVYKKYAINDIRWYDRVIPPFADPDEFLPTMEGPGDYLVFLGRLIGRKGPHIAAQIANAAGLPLKVAGAGMKTHTQGLIVGDGIEIKGNVEYVGTMDQKQRAELLRNARALICPTTYAEPGGNVAIEAMMAGCPVIAPDWGVFSETIRPGIDGFYFRTLRQGAAAVERCYNINRGAIQISAVMRFGLDVIGSKFDLWFEQLQELWQGRGWDAL